MAPNFDAGFPNRPRVVHIWNDFMPGQFIEPHSLLVQSNWESRLLAARGVNSETFDLPGVSYFSKRSMAHAFNPTIWNRGWDRLISPLYWHSYNRFCARYLKRHPPSLLHVHVGVTAAKLLPTLRKISLPSLVTFYGVDASACLRDQKLVYRYQEIYERFQVLLVLCEAVKKRFQLAGCKEEKIKVWNLPAGVENFPYRERRQVKEIRFIIAARFVEKKGYRYLLKAFRGFLDRKKKASLTILGYGEKRSHIEETISDLKLTPHVSLIDTRAQRGFVEIYKKALDSSDIFVLPSTTAKNGDDEGGPALTMVCAQSAGLPVICTTFPGSEISLLDGKTGFYCETDNSDALLEKMVKLAENPSLWNPFGHAGSRLVNERFSRMGQMNQLVKIYDDLL